MRKLAFAALVATSVMAANPASAALVLIDFNNLAVNKLPSLTIGAVTFTSIGGTISSTGPSNLAGYLTAPNGTPGLVGFNTVSHMTTPVVATIAGGTNFVSVEFSTYPAPRNDVFLSAYDASGLFLGSIYDFFPVAVTGIKTLTISRPGIASVIFGSQAAISTIYDNFIFDAGVPEPASWALMIGGFGMIGTALRRRSHRAVIA